MKVRFFSYILSFLLLTSCNKKEEVSSFEVIDDYLIAYTRGIVSSKEALQFIFKSPLPETKKDLSSYFSISPPVKGAWNIIDGNQLVFTPEEKYKNGAKYSVHLKLSKMDSRKYKGDMTLSFEVVQQYLNIELEGVEIKAEENYQYILLATCADEVEEEKLSSCILTDSKDVRVSPIGDRQYKIIVNYDKSLKKDSRIHWRGKAIGAEGEGRIEMFQPEDFSDFGVLYDQYLVKSNQFKIFFSRRLDPNQNLSGMILVDGKPIEPQINGNVLQFYVEDRSANQSLKIQCSRGIKSVKGEALQSDVEFVVQTPAVNPEAQFVDKSNYIPSSQQVKIPIRTRNLKSVQLGIIEIPQENIHHYLAWNSIQNHNMEQIFRLGTPIYFEELALNPLGNSSGDWEHYGIDLSDKFDRNPGALYILNLQFGPQNTRLVCDDNFKELEIGSTLDKELKKWKDSAKQGYYNYYSGYNHQYQYNWNEREDPCKISYYIYRNTEHLQVQASDMGIVAKQGVGEVSIAAVDLVSLESIRQAKVTLFNFQGMEIASGSTNDKGLCSFKIEDRAAVVAVEKDDQKVFLSLNQNSANDLSAFPISGSGGTKRDYFVYTNRGIWRPGDSIAVNLMVNGRTTQLPNGLPIIFEFFDLNGVLIAKEKQVFSSDKLIYSFASKTETRAKTGNYRVKIHVGAEVLNKTIPVETIRPNDIEIQYAFSEENQGVIQDRRLDGRGKMSYLNGFPVKGGKVAIQGLISSWVHPFPKWKNYTFELSKDITNRLNVRASSIDNEGRFQLNSDMDLKKLGTRRNLRLESKIELPGGGVNQMVHGFKLDPFEYYVGILKKKGKSWRESIEFERGKTDVPIIILDRKGGFAKGDRTVKVLLRKHKKSWWMDQYSLSRRSYYKRKSSWEEISSSTMTIRNGKGAFVHNEKDHGRGVFELVVQDVSSGHQASYHYNVYSSQAQAEVEDSPDRLWIEQSVEECLVGEEVVMKFPEFKQAKALISIEQGDRILETFWMNVSANNRELSLYPDDSWYPNVHIHVTLLQAYGEKSNDRPTRMFSIQALKVGQRKNLLQAQIEAPDVAEIQSPFNVKVSEKGGRPMQYTLAVVDEGLLNLTGFKTPDPKKHFESSIALQVDTWDLYKLLMNKFKGNFAAILNIGGDEAYQADADLDFNRFKPVIKSFGPYQLGRGATASHRIDLGNYAGKVRVMLVACDDRDFSSKESFISIKSPLMLQAQFPRSLNLNDEVKVPVTVFRESEKIANVQLVAESSENRIEMNSPSLKVNFEDNQQLLRVPMQVGNEPGITRVNLKVEGSGKSMKESTEIMVNFPNSYTSESESNLLNKGEEWMETLVPLPFPDYAQHKITVAGLKLPKITEYAEDLIQYPYGCLEQTVSAGFAQLYLDDILKLDPAQKMEREQYVGATITKLRSFQNGNGRFSTWRSGRNYHSWSEIYSGYFLCEARKKGFRVPDQMWRAWLKKQSEVATKWVVSQASETWIQINEEMIQAYRLYVLARCGKPAMSAMNRLNKSMYPNQISYALLAGAYQLAGFEDQAEKLLQSAFKLGDYHRYSYYTYGGAGRNMAIMVDVLSNFPSKKELLDKFYFRMVDQMNSSYYANTHTKAYAFLAVARYLNKNEASYHDEIHFEVMMNGNKEVYHRSYWKPLLFVYDKDEFNKELSIINRGSADIVVDHVKRYIPEEMISENISEDLSMTVSLSGTRLDDLAAPLTISAGGEQMYSVTISNPSPVKVNHLALNVKMPSGFELINPRVNQTVQFPKQSSYEYQDYRDDRVYTFFALEANESKTFYFKTNAAFQGKFVLPPVSCEHMYDGDIRAVVKSNRLIIE